MTKQATDGTPLRTIHVDLRTGDLLMLPGVRIELEKKKGQATRMKIVARADARVKKVPRALRPVPSLPS